MKTKFVLVLLFVTTAFLAFSQNAFKGNQVILQFAPTSTQTDRMEMISELGNLLQDEDGDLDFIDELVLVHISQFPVTVSGITYQDEVELTGGIHNNHARLDGSDLNYKIQQTETNFSLPFGNPSSGAYSPVSPSCEGVYPGGALQADDFSNYDEEGVLVAVLDTGLDPYYDFINQYLVGAADVLMDDEGVGEFRYMEPYDFSAPIAVDLYGHGTAVTGIIAGLSDRANVPTSALRLFPIKCFNDNGEGELFNMIQALRVAKDIGADITNLSWSYISINENNVQILEERINTLSNDHGMLLITSAGNSGVDVDDVSVAPASFLNAINLITVGGIEEGCVGPLAAFSNYGFPVHIAAPGEGLMVPGLQGYWSADARGTSFSAPIVTAAAVQTWLCLSRDFLAGGFISTPDGIQYPVRTSLLNTAVPVDDLQTVGIEGVVSFSGACSYTSNSQKSLTSQQTNPYEEIYLEPLVHEKTDFTVFPNPFSDRLNISVRPEESVEQVILFNVAREEVSVNTDNLSISLSQLPTGIYIIQVHTDHGVYTRKILKR